MKTIKITLFLTAIALFTSVPFVTEAKDCSEFKKLHKKLLCKAKVTKEKDSSGESFNEKYNSLADIIKKLKK